MDGNITIQNINTWHGSNDNVHVNYTIFDIGRCLENVQTNYQNNFYTKMNMNNETYDSSCHMRFFGNSSKYRNYIYIIYNKSTYYNATSTRDNNYDIRSARSYISFRPCFEI